MRWSRIYSLIVKELKGILADKSNRNMILLSPILQLVLFAYTATLEIKNVYMAVYDKDNTVMSRNLSLKFEETPIIKKVYHINNRKDMLKLVNNEKVFVVVTIPQNFEKNILDGTGSEIQVLMDGRRSNASQISASYISTIIQKYMAELNEYNPQQQKVEIRSRNLFNPSLNYQWYILVCLTGILAMNMTFMITAMAIAQEKELGTFDQTIVSPLKSYEIILGKTIPAIMVSLFDVTLMIIGSKLIFSIPIEGSIIVLYICIIVFLLAMSGIGLAISIICKTQQQSVLGMFIFTMPVMLLSGFMSPIDNMPVFFQKIAQFNPLTYFFILIRGTFLKSLDGETIMANLIPLIIMATVTMTFSCWFFNKKLD